MISSIVLAAAVLGGAAAPAQPGVHLQKAGNEYRLTLDGAAFRASKSPIANLQILALPGSDKVVATWKEAGKPFYAISIDGVSMQRVAQASTQLLLRTNTFDPLTAPERVPARFRAGASNEIYIVQFTTQPLQEYLEAIEAAGGKPYIYLPNQAYIVQMDGAAKQAVQNLPYVRWVGAYHPHYRLDPRLSQGLESNTLSTDTYNLWIFESGSTQKVPVANRLRSLGATVNDETPVGHMMGATLSPQALAEVATWNEVMYIDVFRPLEPDMDIVRNFGGANYVFTQTGFKGRGVSGQVRDTGVRQTHQDFQNPLVQVRANTTDTSHGSSTFGIVFGQGRANSMGTGMLPEGSGVFLANVGNGGWPTQGAQRFLDTQQATQAPYYCVFESNSTGQPQVTTYTTDSANMDDLIFQLDILICQSQSNTGNQNSRPQAWAKNIVAVGGITHQNTLTRADDAYTSASIGPASDGRIKPDLAHFYDNVFTTSNGSDTSYTSGFNGTSAATPITAGHFGLLFQMWSEGVFGNTTVGNTVFERKCHAMTAKALMINTATQWLFTQGNRYRQGWGSAQVDSLYDARLKMLVVDETDVLLPLQSKSYRVLVVNGEPAFRATMCYKDPPGNPNVQSQHRVNDLTLKVTDPGGTVYYGNNGLAAGQFSTAGGVANTKDTVENVFVQNPAAGVWTVEVIGSEIVQDSHLQTNGVIDADYALVVTGIASRLLPTNITLERGIALGGTSADTQTSNNVSWVLRPGIVFSTSEAPISVVADYTSPTSTLTRLDVTLEAMANQGNIGQRIELFNWNTNSYDMVDSRNATTSDSVVTATQNAPAAYVNGSGNIRVRVSYKTVGPVFSYPWTASIDQLRLVITP